jgi:hypothetical protein
MGSWKKYASPSQLHQNHTALFHAELIESVDKTIARHYLAWDISHSAEALVENVLKLKLDLTLFQVMTLFIAKVLESLAQQELCC